MPDFHGFRNLFSATLPDLKNRDRNPPCLGQYFLNFAPVKSAPGFLFNISQFCVNPVKLNNVKGFRWRMNFHENCSIPLTEEIWLVNYAHRCFNGSALKEFFHVFRIESYAAIGCP